MSLQQQLDTETNNALEFFRGMTKDDLQTIMTGFDAMASADARRWKLLAVSLHKQANSAVSPAPVSPVSPDESSIDLTQDMSRKRFFSLMLVEIRTRILNGELQPTLGKTTAAVTDVIRQHTQVLGLQPSLIGKPDRQKIAEKILEKLEWERVIEKTPNGGVGIPLYQLAARWRSN